MSAAFEFYNCKQENNQPFGEWLAVLRDKAQNCGFSESQLRENPLDRALRDAILMGTNSFQVRQALLKKKDPSLIEVINIAKECEMILKEEKRIQRS